MITRAELVECLKSKGARFVGKTDRGEDCYSITVGELSVLRPVYVMRSYGMDRVHEGRILKSGVVRLFESTGAAEPMHINNLSIVDNKLVETRTILEAE